MGAAGAAYVTYLLLARRFSPLAIALVMAGCGNGAPTASTTPAPTLSTPTPQPIPSPTTVNGRVVVSNLDDKGGAVVAGILFPASGYECGGGASYDNCPVTDVLAKRLDSMPMPRTPSLCRCTNMYQSVSITTEPLPAGSSGVIAHVALNFGADIEKIDVRVMRTSAGWFASDTSCTGQDPTATSIYAASPPPCG